VRGPAELLSDDPRRHAAVLGKVQQDLPFVLSPSVAPQRQPIRAARVILVAAVGDRAVETETLELG